MTAAPAAARNRSGRQWTDRVGFDDPVRPTPLHLHLPALALFCATALPAQCADPVPLASGFLLTEQLDQQITFGDTSVTKLDVRYPAVAPSNCGWPVLVLVHGYSGSRKDLSAEAKAWARTGYLVVSYDVRGQGDSKTLNPANIGSAFVGKEERLDLAEVILWIGTTYGGAPKLADTTRLAVGGPSQGGLHAWAAAAWSGKPLPTNSRGITTFPTISAACAKIFPAMDEAVFVPGGTTFLNNLLAILWRVSSVRMDATFESTLKGYVLAEDFTSTNAFFANDPWRDDRAQLATSTVPICVQIGWNDTWADAQATLDALAALPATTPRHVQFDAAGGGHGLPPNDRQATYTALAEERWLARFLKGRQNGIDAEAKLQTSLLSADPAREVDPTLLLWNRTYDAWPPANNTSKRTWLRSGNQLSTTAPATPETADTVQNQVLGGFNISAYINTAQLGTTPTFAQMPLDSRTWDSAPLTDDIEIAGRPHVELEVTTTDTTLLLHCALFQLAPGSTERFLTDGTVAVRGATNAPTRLVVDLAPIQVRLPKGQQYRLRIENMPWRRTAIQDEFSVVPCFAPFVVAIEHTAVRPSWLDLPIRPVVMPALLCATDSLYVATPTDLRYVYEAPQSFVGSYYAFLFTTSGTAPVIPLPSPDPLRFFPDATTDALFGATPPFLYGGTSTLPGSGLAYVLLGMRSFAPIPPAWSGARLSTTVLILNGSNLYPTAPIDVIFR